MTPHQMSRMTSYEKFGNPFALIASFIFLVTWVISLIPTASQETFTISRTLFWISWAALVADYFTRVFISGHPFGYIIRNPFGFLGALLPPFRLFYIVHAFSVLSGNRKKLIAQASIGSVIVLFLAIVVGAALVVNYEYGKPGSDIESYGDAIWWSFETVSTVGYGDFVPVTVQGRTVAVLLMIIGVGLASVAAASVISFLAGERKKVDASDGIVTEPAAANTTSNSPSTSASAPPADVSDLSERIQALEEKIDQLISRSR